MNIVAYLKCVVSPWVKARIDAKTELGASLVEYALLVALIAVVAIVGISFLGNRANNQFDSVGSKLQ